MADLFTAFQVAAMHLTSPAMDPRFGLLTGGSAPKPIEWITDGFPGGGPATPVAHPSIDPNAPPNLTVDPTSDDRLSITAWRTNTSSSVPPGPIGRINYFDFGTNATINAPAFTHDTHPALGEQGSDTVLLFDRHPVSPAGAIGAGDIGVPCRPAWQELTEPDAALATRRMVVAWRAVLMGDTGECAHRHGNVWSTSCV